MRKLIVIAVVAGTLAVLAATAMAATSVKVGDDYYVRPSGVPTVSVKKGATVRWRFTGDSPHSVTVSRGPAKFNSGLKSSGTYKRTMKKRGTYTIYCTIHGASDQKMKLVVK
jgi:plastocyanin